MPATARRIVFPSTEDYLANENDGDWRHEYVNGVIYAMAGTSDNHNLIAGNIFANLRLALPDSCQTFSIDMKVYISKAPEEHYYYPDVFVTCSPTDRDRYSRSEPILVVEVLSPSTARVDRHEKFIAYRLLPSLLEYVLVQRDFPHVEMFRKRNDWQHESFEPEVPLVFESVAQTLSFAQVYRQVVLPPE